MTEPARKIAAAAAAMTVFIAILAGPAAAHHGTEADCTGKADGCQPDGHLVLTLAKYGEGCTFDADVSWGDRTKPTHLSNFSDGQKVDHQYKLHGIFTVKVTGSGTPTQEGATCTFTPSTFTVEVPIPMPNPRGGYAVQPNVGDAFTLIPLGPEYPDAGPIAQTITTPKGDQIQLVKFDGKLVPAYIASVLLRAQELGWKPADGSYLNFGYR